MTKPDHISQALKALSRPLRLTRAGMVAERAVRAFWPAWSLALLLVVPLALGVQDILSPWFVITALVLWAALFAFSLRYGLRRFRWPSTAEAQARLDQSLPGRPISSLLDDQAIGAGDDASRAVWQVHVQRMAARAAQARAVEPDMRLSSRDRYGLRYIALTGFVAALTFGSIWRVATVADLTTAPGAAQASGPAWEGWAEPPAYTGRPGLYLNDIIAPVLELPQDTMITLRLYGDDNRAAVSQDIAGEAPTVSDDGVAQDFRVARSGNLSVGERDWGILMERDQPPSVEVALPLEFGQGGEIRQPFQPSDDYGVVAGSVTIRLNLAELDRRYGLTIDPEPREVITLDLPMPITGNRTAFTEVLVENFSEHPWARMPVIMDFEVLDELGQAGRSAPVETNLGGLRFFDPLARAIAEQRRDLLWNRDNGARVLQVLRAATYRPDTLFRESAHYLTLRHAMTRLDEGVNQGLTGEMRDEIAQALWDLALELEFGDLDDARARLERAQERLAEAMRNGADPAEIAELMQELREAMAEYMRLLAQEQSEDGELQSAENFEGESVTQDQLQEMMDKIQELMEQGRMTEAMALLQQLMEMMENIQITQGGEGSPGDQALEGLGQSLREQQDLSDQAFRDLQDRFNPQGREGQQPGQREQGEDGEPGAGERSDAPEGSEPGEGDEGGNGEGPDARSLAERQRDLRQELERQERNMPGLGGELADALRESLDRAGRAMEDAEGNLQRDDLAGALDDQAEAMDALRDGIRNLGQALAEQRQQEGAGGDTGMAQGQQDPLGRDATGDNALGGDGGNFSADRRLSDRARELMDEIRKRSSEQDREGIELDYLKRLMDRF